MEQKRPEPSHGGSVAEPGEDFGTAFWFNDLVNEQGDTETVRQYPVTAGAVTRYDIAEMRLRLRLRLRLRPELIRVGHERPRHRDDQVRAGVAPSR
ncbi:hypothetical protein ACFWOJ_04895 [Streptomyces sp. NPDC058439]|uniref:hypothetical protein n=1 Tax=Streptomyces sp. NPDC058439 TaxID=3346500 RepID=UPI00364C3421